MGNVVLCCLTKDGPKPELECKSLKHGPSFMEGEPSPVPVKEALCVVKCRNDHGASPRWCSRQGKLYWLDLVKQEIWSLEPVSGATIHQAVDLGWHGGSLAFRKDNGFVVCSSQGMGMLDNCQLQENGPKLVPRIVCHPVENEGLDSDLIHLGDGRVDPDGKLVVGTCHSKYTDFVDTLGQVIHDKMPDSKDPRGGVYRISVVSSFLWGLQGQLEKLAGLGKVSVANGTAFASNREGKPMMYFVDTPTHQVRSYHYGAAISTPTPVTEPLFHQGRPGGACVDTDGGYWIAEMGAGRIMRIKDGQAAMFIQVEHPMVTSCTFGGPDLDILYITTASEAGTEPSDGAGALFACPGTGFKGMPEFCFRG